MDRLVAADRKLLERAGHAAGMTIEWQDNGQPGYWSDYRGLPQWEYWNPLRDDGDALRLAAKLRMRIEMYSLDTGNWAHVSVDRGHGDTDEAGGDCHESVFDEDYLCAIRVAIVKLAAGESFE